MLRNIVLEAREIWKESVLRGLNLEVLEGDIVAILGQPGSGKTTLLRILGFQEAPDKGQIFFEGRLAGLKGEEETTFLSRNKVLFLTGKNGAGEALDASFSPSTAVILFDEPGYMLGKRTLPLALEKIKKISKKGTSVIIVTREPVVAAEAGIIYRLDGGKLVLISGHAG